MFKRKCKKCGKKISREFEFCPYCGSDIKKYEENRNFGLLGRDDFFSPDMGIKMPFGFNRLFNSLLKQLDSQFKEFDREIGKEIRVSKKNPEKISKGISISISTASGKKPEIKIHGFGPGFENSNFLEEEKEIKKISLPKTQISEYQAKKISKLPKEEAETKVRRMSNKIVYEISLPGVKNLKDIVINQLENSIEIKAFSKDKVYFKLLPINFPILNYKLDKENLVLELKTKE